MFFKKKKTDFYNLLSEQARKVEEGMKAFVVYMRDPHPLHGETVLRIEEEADDIRKNLVETLNQTFITPIDREDIYGLSRSVDDIIDYAKLWSCKEDEDDEELESENLLYWTFELGFTDYDPPTKEVLAETKRLMG